MDGVDSIHDDEIVEVFVLDDEEDEGKGKEDEEQEDEKEQEPKQHEVGQQPGRKKFVCLLGEDHVVNEEGKCTVGAHESRRVCEWCDSCQVYFMRPSEWPVKVHTRGFSHRHLAANPVVFDVRCNSCGRHSWTDFRIAKQKCSCGGALEKKCPECLEWFGFSGFAIHFTNGHIRENEASAVPKPHLNDKLDPPKRNREKAVEANAAKPLKKMQKKNNEKVEEMKDAVKKKAVKKKANKKVGKPMIIAAAAPGPAPGAAQNRSFVDFVRSLEHERELGEAVIKICREQMLMSEQLLIELDDSLFAELEVGQPIGVKHLLRKIDKRQEGNETLKLYFSFFALILHFAARSARNCFCPSSNNPATKGKNGETQLPLNTASSRTRVHPSGSVVKSKMYSMESSPLCPPKKATRTLLCSNLESTLRQSVGKKNNVNKNGEDSSPQWVLRQTESRSR